MKWKDDIGLELYVATERYPHQSQYINSQRVLELIDRYGIRDRIEVIALDKLNGEVKFFQTIKVTNETKLPFLVCASSGAMGTFLGYSGLEEITEILSSMFKASQKTS